MAIHPKASICPHCRSKQSADLGQVGCLALVGIAIFITAAVSFFPATGGKASSDDDKAAFVAAHGGDPRALDDRFGGDADAQCSAHADDYLRSAAAHDFQWDQIQGGWLGFKFYKYSTRSASRGLLTVISHKAKLSNGFGAFEHVDLYCVYDVVNNRAVKFSLSDPSDAVDEVVPPPPGNEMGIDENGNEVPITNV